MNAETALAQSRYAIYYKPARDSELGKWGAKWLGRDTFTGEILEQPSVADISPELLQSATQKPRHYGFHATLKPPFALKEGIDETQLLSAFKQFTQQQPVVQGSVLAVSAMAKFLALKPVDAQPQVNQLAANCVALFDGLRRPASAQELAMRRAAGLTPRQDSLLQQWGYPYVMDQFRFHMTLTGAVDQPMQNTLQSFLEVYFATVLQEPLIISGLALAHQTDRQSPFVVLDYQPLAG